MKKLRKLVKPIISLLVILSMVLSLPTPVIAQTMITESIDSISMSDSTSDEADVVQGNIIGEDISKRDEFTKHFITDAGTTIAAQYAVPVHYKDDDGDYVDYDNSLTSSQVISAATSDEATLDEATADEVSYYSLRIAEEEPHIEEILVNKKSNSKVSHYKKTGKANLIEIERDGHKISWGYSGANVVTAQEQEKSTEELTGNDAYLTLTNLSSTVVYENIYNNVDLEIINSTTGIKENLILKSSNAKNVFKIEYNIGDLIAESTDTHTIDLKDRSGKVVYIISAPYMKDTAGETSEALELKILSNNKGKLSVKLTADKTWLKDKSRAYPVAVDPTVNYRGNDEEVTCTYIYESEADTERTVEQFFFVGTNSDEEYTEKRGLIKINQMPQLSNGDMIVDVQAGLYLCPIGQLFTTSYIGVYEMTEDWTVSGKGTWNEVHNSYDKNLIDYNKLVANQEEGWLTWNITELAKKWYYTPESNNGIMVKMVDGTSVNQDVRFTSPTFAYDDESLQIARPTFLITYRNNKGIEDRWSYTAVDCGRAGIAYINDYSGSLVFKMPIASTASPVLAANLRYYYNSYSAYKKYDITKPYNGWGWRMNIQQTVYETTGDLADEYPYVYTDADGTEHYFCPKIEEGITKYYDEDGLGLELVLSNDKYKIITKSDDILEFNSSGLLIKSTNKAGQAITIVYDEDANKIKYIVDSEGYTISFSSLNSYDYVLEIKDCDSKVTKITYSGIFLKTVTYNDNKTVTFGYDGSGKLTSVTDVDNSKVEFVYSNYGSKGVKTVLEKGTGESVGQKITFDRSKYNTTVMRTSGLNGAFGDSDDYITTCQFNNAGMLTSTYSKTAGGEYLSASDATYTSNTVNSDASNIKTINKVSQTYTVGANNENMLKNHNLEGTENWSKADWGSTGTVDFDIAANSSASNVLYGQKSVRMTVNSVTEDKRGRISQTIDETYLELGATYTLSCYVKVTEMTPIAANDTYGAVIGITVFYDDKDKPSINYYSEHISQITDTEINNGFRRLSVTVNIPKTATDIDYIKANLAIHSAVGTAYFDGVQLEKAEAPGCYNMLENSNFESSAITPWSGTNITSADTKSTDEKLLGNTSMLITGDVAKAKNFHQDVIVNGNKADTYILSGWAKGNAVPNETNSSYFELRAKVFYSDGSSVTKSSAPFNTTLNDWQYASFAFNLDNKENDDLIPTKIRVYLISFRQGEPLYFDNIMLAKEAVPSYTYDEEGNLTSVVANSEQESNYSYEDNESEVVIKPEDNIMTKYVNPNDKEYSYKYYENKQIKSVITPSGLTANYTYDSKGNPDSVELVYEGDATTPTDDLMLSESITYTYGQGVYPTYSVKATNQRGMESIWRYDAKDGTLTGYTDPKGNSITYTYNAKNDVLESATNDAQNVSYGYDEFFKHRTSITHGNTVYSFTYDQFGNNLTNSVGNRLMNTNVYAGNNGSLERVNYGNGHYTEYEYDCFGNKSVIKHNGSTIATNYANARGDIIRSVDNVNALEYRASFDTLGRLISKDVYSSNANTNADTFRRSVEYDYDIMNNLTKLSFVYNNGVCNTTHYFYDGYNRPLSSMLQSGKTLRNYYDGLNRVTKSRLNTTTPIETLYSYINIGSDTTTVLDTEVSNAFAYSYYYDNNGNITAIQNGTKQSDGTYTYSASSGHKYEYDRYNQLITDIDYANERVTYYTYDTNGNITQKFIRNWSTASNTHTGVIGCYGYSYEDTNGWGDLLTSWAGQTLTYDAIGNPLTYRDGITMTWQNGRELASFENDDVAVTYTYNPNGLRTKKSITTTSDFTTTTTNVEYVYEGGLLMRMTYGDRIFDFSYDVSGNPIGFNYTIPSASVSSYYYYGLNSRGDIEALYTATGSISAIYEYDAYGQLLSVKNSSGTAITGEYSIAHLNPLRYRGYVYDSETGFYYLQSRYYDPTICRFINADIYYETGQGINGYNMFAYCNNNPIMYLDLTGCCMVMWANGYQGPCPGINSPNCMDNVYKEKMDVLDKKTLTFSGRKEEENNIETTASFWWFDVEKGSADTIEISDGKGTYNLFCTDDFSVGLEQTYVGMSKEKYVGLSGFGCEVTFDVCGADTSLSYDCGMSFSTFTLSFPFEVDGYTHEEFTRIKVNNHHVGVTVLACIFAPEFVPYIIYGVGEYTKYVTV